MKKNLMSVIILAFVVANFALTALNTFVLIPQNKKSNELIEDICSAIDLDLNSGAASGVSNLPQDQIVDYALNGGEDNKFSFKTDESGKQGVLVCNISISLNNESTGYETYGSDMSQIEDRILNEFTSILNNYTMTEYNKNKDEINDEILSSLQEKFGSDFIVGINFKSALTSEY